MSLTEALQMVINQGATHIWYACDSYATVLKQQGHTWYELAIYETVGGWQVSSNWTIAYNTPAMWVTSI